MRVYQGSSQVLTVSSRAVADGVAIQTSWIACAPRGASSVRPPRKDAFNDAEYLEEF